MGQYGTVAASWGTITVSVPVAFYNVGYTRFSQYNTPYEPDPSCNGSPQTAWIVNKIDKEADGICYYHEVSLGSKFMSQVGGVGNGTGTGALGTGQVVNSYAAGAKNVCSPAPRGSAANTFFAVDVGGNAEF